MAQPNTECILEKENLWNSILNSVHTHSNKNLTPDQNIVILGDSEVGKTSLVAKLQGIDDSKKGWGLEYSFLNVTDTYEEETRLGVWILDGLESYAPLLKYALNERTFENTIVLILASMTHPWSILTQLQKWTEILRKHIAGLNIDSEKLEQNRQRIIKKWKSYVEPNDELNLASPLKRSSTHYFDYDVMADSSNIDLMQLSEGVLVDNFGIEMVVVITKTDNIAVLEKDYYFKDEMLDFIQQWIRRFCLNFGSALFYVSCKEDKNCDVLLKYLLNRIYGFQFKSPALVVDKDAVFIPMGWDTMKKIAILYENMHTCDPNAEYCSVIVPPTTQNATDELETIAEDEQEFLSRQLKLLQSNKEKMLSDSNDEPVSNLDINSLSPSSRSTNVHQTKMSPRLQNSTSSSPIYQSGTNTKSASTDGQKNTNENGEINLINFFNLLLSKKSGTTKQPAPSSPDKINLQKNDSSEA